MTPHNVLFLTDRGERHQQQVLQAAPPQLSVTILRTPPRETLFAALPQTHFLITERNQPVTAEMINVAWRLKLIVRLGSLTYDIDVGAAIRRNIVVSMVPVIGVIHCAEHALMMLLALSKRLGRSLAAALAAEHDQEAQRGNENTFSFNWLGYTDLTGLTGKTISIIGMGEIGVELARRLFPFRPARVLYHKRTPYPASVETELGLTYADLSTALHAADYLVSLLPYSPQTDFRNGGGLDSRALSLLKPGAMLVHLGSGSVLDEAALLERLRAGLISGAALDTYEYEPLQKDHPLVTAAHDPQLNLLLTPHTAAAGASADRSGDYQLILDYLQTRSNAG